jgi:GT2 family glycosyltransferase
VIVPSHNTRERTLRCLASAVAQRDEVLELILVDNGSRDGTADAVASAFPGVRLLSFREPMGFSRAANLGAGTARGEILLFLNADAELLPGALAALNAAFRGRPRLGAAGARLESDTGAEQWSGGRFPTLAWMLALGSGLPAALASLPFYRSYARARREREQQELASVDWVSGAALAVRTAAFQRAGKFQTGYRFYAQDVELCAALADQGLSVAIVEGFRVRHALGASVAQLPGAHGDPVDLTRLLPDLVRWGELRRGAPWGAAAAKLLLAALSMRIAARRLRAPFLAGARRAAFGRETRRYVRARRSLARSTALS